jgi:hypothetical protein
MVNEAMRKLGAQGNPMRVLFEYGKKRAAVIGAENVLDFALGNPSVPPPARVNEVIREVLSGPKQDSIHAYTSAPGDLEVRDTLAQSLNRRFNASCHANDLFLTSGAAPALCACLKGLCCYGDQFIVIAPYFTEYRVFIEGAGGEVLEDDMGYCGQGVAQGGIVDTPDGKWYAILFQDSGAVGRIPVLVPVTWENDYPVFGIDGKVPRLFTTESTRPEHVYDPLIDSDDFRTVSDDKRRYGSFGFRSAWQFNHEPDLSLVTHDTVNGIVRITTDKLCADVTQARNTLTQRMIYPGCTGEVTVDVRGLNDGDCAGFCALQSSYGWIGIKKRDVQTFLVMERAVFDRTNTRTVTEEAAVPVTGDTFRLRITAEFTEMKDEVRFAYLDGEEWKPLGPVHKMSYRLDHFTGYRFALFAYSTENVGGSAEFSDFVYTVQE